MKQTFYRMFIILAIGLWIFISIDTCCGFFSLQDAFSKGAEVAQKAAVGSVVKILVDHFKSDPPISTSLSDAYPHFRSIKDFKPNNVPEKFYAELSKNGSIQLGPGVYDFYLRSFCLKAGAYSPTKGSGYLMAPLKGSRQKIVFNIMQNYGKHSEVEQQNVQELLWAIKCGLKYNEFPKEIKSLSEILLSGEDLKELGKSFWDILPKEVYDRLFSEFSQYIPAEVYDELKTYYQARNLFLEDYHTYQEMEKLCVKYGEPEGAQNSLEVKYGEWSLTSEGYFIRLFCDYHLRSRIQVLVPPNMQMSLSKNDKNQIETVSLNDLKVNFTYIEDNIVDNDRIQQQEYSLGKLVIASQSLGKNATCDYSKASIAITNDLNKYRSNKLNNSLEIYLDDLLHDQEAIRRAFPHVSSDKIANLIYLKFISRILLTDLCNAMKSKKNEIKDGDIDYLLLLTQFEYYCEYAFDSMLTQEIKLVYRHDIITSFLDIFIAPLSAYAGMSNMTAYVSFNPSFNLGSPINTAKQRIGSSPIPCNNPSAENPPISNTTSNENRSPMPPNYLPPPRDPYQDFKDWFRNNYGKTPLPTTPPIDRNITINNNRSPINENYYSPPNTINNSQLPSPNINIDWNAILNLLIDIFETIPWKGLGPWPPIFIVPPCYDPGYPPFSQSPKITRKKRS